MNNDEVREVANRLVEKLNNKLTDPRPRVRADNEIQVPIRDLQLVIDFALRTAPISGPFDPIHHGRHIIEFEGDIFVAFDPTTNDALFAGVFRSLGEAERAVRDCIEEPPRPYLATITRELAERLARRHGSLETPFCGHCGTEEAARVELFNVINPGTSK